MVMLPVWIIRETETELICYLGSDPPATAKVARIPKDIVATMSAVHADEITAQEAFTKRLPHLSGCLFSVVMLDASKIPDELRNAMYPKPAVG